jgi:hypothetical protein
MNARGHHGLMLAGSTTFAAYMASLLPVAWWRMGDVVGSTYLNDSIANEQAVLTGTAGTNYTLGSPGLVSGDTDKSVTFNGGWANSGATTKWSLGTGDFSAFCIAKWTGTALNVVACDRDASPTNILFLLMVNATSVGDVSCWSWNYGTQKISVAGSYNDGNRHVLALTYKASTNELRFYVDGVLKQTQVQAGSNSRPTAPTMAAQIANNAGLQPFIGATDEFAVFNRLLNDAEMAGAASLALTGTGP